MNTITKKLSKLSCLALSVAALLCSCGKDPQHLATGSTKQVSTAGTCSGLTVTTGLQAWLDAANIDAPNGTGVSSWKDCVNTGFSVAQATPAKQPVYSTTGGPGNLPFVTFDGVQQYLSGSPSQLTFTSGVSIFLLMSIADYTADGMVTHPLLYNDAGAKGFSVEVYHDLLNPNVGNKGSTTFGSGTYTANTWYLVTFVLNEERTGILEYQNGLPTGVHTYAAPFVANGPSLELFDNNAHNKFTSGKLAEMMLFNATLSAADIQTVNCYLSTKYKLQLGICNP